MIAPTERKAASRPCLILGSGDAAYARRMAGHFRRSGWEVCLAPSGPDVRRLARLEVSQLVVLDIDLGPESGWLTCSKLHQEHPELPVILVDADPSPRDRRWAHFVGATRLMDRGEDVEILVEGFPGPEVGRS